MLFFSFYLNALSEMMAMTQRAYRPRSRQDASSKPQTGLPHLDMPSAVVPQASTTAVTPVPLTSKAEPSLPPRPRLVAVNGQIVAPNGSLTTGRPPRRPASLRVVRSS